VTRPKESLGRSLETNNWIASIESLSLVRGDTFPPNPSRIDPDTSKHMIVLNLL